MQTLVSPRETDHNLSEWAQASLREFRSRMTDQDNLFPCIFGVEAVVRGTLRYAFISSKGDQASNLATALQDYTEICDSLGKRTSLVCFFEHWAEEKTHEAYFQHFWQLLNDTSELDTKPWPAEFSPKPDEASFEYSFNDHPMFVVINTELHENRLSRAFSRVAVTFQPRFVFDDIREGTTKGDDARTIIRGRLKDYDNVDITPLLGSFGDESNREWKQYYLDDGTDIEQATECPVKNFVSGHQQVWSRT